MNDFKRHLDHLKAVHEQNKTWTAQDEYYHGKQVTEEEAAARRKADEPARLSRDQQSELLYQEEKKIERAWREKTYGDKTDRDMMNW